VLQPKLPPYDYSLVVRTDFADEAAWQLVCEEIRAPQTEDGFQASVECVSDKECSGLTPKAVCELLPDRSDRSFIFIVDSQTLSNAEHPVLAVDAQESSRTFRVIPAAAWAVENNLRLANMGFDDFEASLGQDGVYREIDS
jgi:hypothetical protein